MTQALRIALLPIMLAGLAAAAKPPAVPPSPGGPAASAPPDLLAAMTMPLAARIVAQAPASAWAAVLPEDLLLLDLDTGQRVVIALAPAFAPVHVANIRRLARSGWFDGITVNRVQDNYVTQWGDPTEKKPLPTGIVDPTPAEYERPLAGIALRPSGYPDAYAARVGHAGGWAVASDGQAAWLPHCYAMVAVGRGLAPDTGTGAELYTVIGQAPRHLDRNLAVVGRILAGMEALSGLPRGTETLGFYKDGAPRPAIVRARIAADLPVGERPGFEVLRSDAPDFARWVAAKANRKDAFFTRPAGALDICNALPPVRAVRPSDSGIEKGPEISPRAPLIAYG